MRAGTSPWALPMEEFTRYRIQETWALTPASANVEGRCRSPRPRVRYHAAAAVAAARPVPGVGAGERGAVPVPLVEALRPRLPLVRADPSPRVGHSAPVTQPQGTWRLSNVWVSGAEAGTQCHAPTRTGMDIRDGGPQLGVTRGQQEVTDCTTYILVNCGK